MKIINYITGILLIAGLASCNDDAFLEEKPSTFYTIDNGFTSSTQVDQTLISCYQQLRMLRVNHGESPWINNLRHRGTDMFDVCRVFQSNPDNDFSDYSLLSPLTNTYYQVFNAWYAMIEKANLALYVAELPGIAWTSAAEKAYAVAQARFFRALSFMMLGELFGGVPIISEIAKAPRYDFERTTRIETYQFAIDDLEAVLNDLPVTHPSGGRIVRGAAQHYLAELYLAMGTQLAEEGKTGEAQSAFTSSINYANQVIDGGTYELVKARFGTRQSEESFSINIYATGYVPVDTLLFIPNFYWDMYQEGNVDYQPGNRETIWSIPINYQAYRTEDRQSVLPYARLYSSIGYYSHPRHFWESQREEAGGRGVAVVVPTNYTRDIVYSGDFADDIRNSEVVFRRRFKANVSTSPYYLQVIPWDDLYEGSEDPLENLNVRSSFYPLSCKITTDRFTGLADGQNRSNLFRDEYLIRLSETILLRAEAKQRNGDKGGAAADINLLRDRAQCTYKVTAADMDDKFDMILDERARELVYEEWRWNTLLRMGGTIAVDRIRKYAFWPRTAETLNFNYNLWPIPQTVIDSNLDVKLQQNPGWENR